MTGNSVPPVVYDVTLQPSRHEMEVKLTLTGGIAKGTIHLQIPTWVPGDYSFAPQARDLFNVSARCGVSGEVLVVRRNGWQGFVVEGGRGVVEVSYRASAWGDDLSESAGLVDDTAAIVLGARYLFVAGYLGPCRVRYVLPDGWPVHHPSGATRVGEETAWDYPSYEILLDTPVAMGTFDLVRRDVFGVPFYFLFLDRGVGYESGVSAFVEKVCKTAEVFREIFGSFPFEDYTFLLSLNPNNDWGLEHLTSTMCGLGPNVFVTDDDNAIGVRVCAHELFHAWNVRRCRPSPLNVLDTHLTEGAFTEGLWVAEGFTRYYEFLSCARAGVYTATQFFSNIVGYHRHLTVQPAYERVSAADSSYTSYLNHQQYAGRVNNGIDYYDKGMLIAFGIDATLRTEVPGQSLDRAFSAFYEQFVGFGPGTSGYSTTDVIGFFTDIHPPLRALLSGAVEHPAGLSTPEQLRALGFEVRMALAPCLGLVFQTEVGTSIYGVLDDSAAGAAGLAPGDVLTAIDGFAFSPEALTWVGGRTAPVTLTVMRGNRSLSFTLTPSPRERIAGLRWTGTTAQKEAILGWLGQAEDTMFDGKPVPLDFYENFHGVEVVV